MYCGCAWGVCKHLGGEGVWCLCLCVCLGGRGGGKAQWGAVWFACLGCVVCVRDGSLVISNKHLSHPWVAWVLQSRANNTPPYHHHHHHPGCVVCPVQHQRQAERGPPRGSHPWHLRSYGAPGADHRWAGGLVLGVKEGVGARPTASPPPSLWPLIPHPPLFSCDLTSVPLDPPVG